MDIHGSDRVNSQEGKTKTRPVRPDWYQSLKTYCAPDNIRASWQLVNTLVPYFGLWFLMVWLRQLGYPYTIVLLLALPAGAFLVRVFILFHDCVHGSFFSSKKANTFFGYVLGVLVFTAFEEWRFSHLRHHGNYANLDARGFGDIWIMTLKEYQSLSRIKRLQYRLYRNPIVLFGLGAVFNFLLKNRIADLRGKRKERMSVILTNLCIVLIAMGAAWMIGWRTYLLIQLLVLWIAGAAGVWLFYVQHQFEGGYWARKDDWAPLRAAMEGCSFYKLPAVLRWFSGNIGYHHVHHLNPKIPNYHLKKCFDAVPALQTREPLTIFKSLSCCRVKLWDEDSQKMVAFP